MHLVRLRARIKIPGMISLTGAVPFREGTLPDTGSRVFVEVKGPGFCNARIEMSGSFSFMCYPGVHPALTSED